MKSSDLAVFSKYHNAPGHAFSNGIVSEDDKDTYQSIFNELLSSVREAISRSSKSVSFIERHTRFYRDGGIQGQRPVDLWASVINKESDPFGKYPQVYVIASAEGLEIGFTVAIHESDYYNNDIKLRNRAVVPILYQKLPDPSSVFVSELDAQFKNHGIWKYGLKSRQGNKGNFDSIFDLFTFLKSPKSSEKGGGSIYFTVSPLEIDSADFDLNQVFFATLTIFTPLMRMLTPKSNETQMVIDQIAVSEFSEVLPDFDANNIDDGRKKVLRALAARLGQSRFREQLLLAYGQSCAICKTKVASVLQAAHIIPFMGDETNHIQNGILLRADIHNLFDLGLINIDPDSYTVKIADELINGEYGQFQGARIQLPDRISMYPSKQALKRRLSILGINDFHS